MPAPAPPPAFSNSLWLESASSATFPSLQGELEADVAIVGCGISGACAAAMIAATGRSVVILEADRVGAGVTGHTTGKVSSLQATIYSKLEHAFGEREAKLYAQANDAGRQILAELIDEYSLDCDWQTRDAWTYAADESEEPSLREEFAAALRGGLDVRLAPADELPFKTAGAICLPDQAQFNAARFVIGLADALTKSESRNVRIFEGSRVTGIRQRPSEASVRTANGSVTAGHVIVASHLPFADRGLFFARLESQRSYCVAARVDDAPRGMYISTGSNSRSLRSATNPGDGAELLIVGGEGHRVGTADTRGRYETLAAFAANRFDAPEPLFRWSSQDNISLDHAPYVGPLWPGSTRLLVVTGFNKWGLANAAASAVMLRDLIAGEEHPWLKVYNSSRLHVTAAAKSFAEHNAVTGWYLVKDNLTARSSPVCSHLGCRLHWNAAERSWDCPCHGSRFDTSGKVLHGPAVRDLSAPAPAPIA